MTLALECGLLTSLYCTSFADEPWYGDQYIVHSLVQYFLESIANPGVQKCRRALAIKYLKRANILLHFTLYAYECCMAKLM